MVSEAETGSSVVSSCWLLFLWFCFSSIGLDVSGPGAHGVYFFSNNILLPPLNPRPHTDSLCSACLHHGQYKNDLSPVVGEGQGPQTLPENPQSQVLLTHLPHLP